jgi:hypothetical protein
LKKPIPLSRSPSSPPFGLAPGIPAKETVMVLQHRGDDLAELFSSHPRFLDAD